MNLKFKEGNIIEIDGEKYQVLRITEDIDWYDVEKDKIVGEHIAIELYKFGIFSLHPTHLLKIYYNNPEEAVLLKIIQEKQPKELEHPRQRGNIFSFHEEKIIPVKEIKIVSKKNNV